jgi:hypothetical protein
VLSQRRIDGIPLDVEDVDTEPIGHDLHGGTTEAESHVERNAHFLHHSASLPTALRRPY